MKRPYQPPELRRLELEQLTAEQRAWVQEQRAKAVRDHSRGAWENWDDEQIRHELEPWPAK